MADNNKAMSLDNTKQYILGILRGWISNKSTLDKLSESQSGDLLFDGNAVGSGSGTGCDDTPMSEVSQILIDIFGQETSWPGDIVSFADGTDAQIAAMLQAHYAGDIDIHDYWNVGDTRTIQLSAITSQIVPTATGGDPTEQHAAQEVEVVLTNAGGYYDENNVECAFVWQQKNGLAEPGYMNSTNTNTGGWSSSIRRNWLNSIYKQALPSGFASLLKTCTIRTAQENQTGVLYVDTQDTIILPSVTEVLGTVTDYYNIAWNDGYEGSQWDYYKTVANQQGKKMGSVGSDDVVRILEWMRSPSRYNATGFMRLPQFSGGKVQGSPASSVTTTTQTSNLTYHYILAPAGFI